MSLDLWLWLRAQTVAEESGRSVLTWEAAEWTDAGRELLAPVVAGPPHRKFGLFLISKSLSNPLWWATRMCRFLYQTLNEAILNNYRLCGTEESLDGIPVCSFFEVNFLVTL